MSVSSVKQRLAFLLTAIVTVTARAEVAVNNTMELDTITVVASGVSSMASASAGDIGQAQIASQPLLRPAAVLENVPGLIVTQHSGEGKANQYFLRGFNLDHGTDLATEIDDMPINMPTHAHGQGYTDLNFLIPELVSDLHYKKGPYFADEGDFATAGTVRIGLMNNSPNTVSVGWGQDGYRRTLARGSSSLWDGTMLGAGEIYHNDGPFQVPDDYQRFNGVLRYHRGTVQDYWTVTGMAYSGNWNATDQVPERAIAEGVIGRFGSLDPTDGGTSHRSSVSANRVVRSEHSQAQLSAYAIRYQLNLWSTFTDVLKNPLYGDQMLQRDDRVIYGVKGAKTWYVDWGGKALSTMIGLQGRVDDIRSVGIFPTDQRQTLGVTQNAGVLESNGAVYIESSVQWRPTLRTVIGLREDQFEFNVKDKMVNTNGSCNLLSDPLGCDSGVKRASILSPKLGVVLGPWRTSTLYFNVADGYHSNDARGVTRSGENPGVPPVTPLTRARSAELGLKAAWLPQWEITLAAFALKLKSELVFDGDAGATAPSGASTRIGAEWGNTLHFNDWLSAKLNAAVTQARFDQNSPADDLACSTAAASHPCASPPRIVGRYIPNSPTNVIDAEITASRESGWFGSLRARHFGESPLVEDNSAKAPAYTTVDAQVGFRKGCHWKGALDVFNLFDTRWNDIAFYYVSRLPRESSPRADYVIHPGVPRTWRARFQWEF
jgi:hypothetical protein